MTVVLKKKHCIDTTYDSVRDCALFRAISEQHPDFKLFMVFEDYVVTKDNEKFSFDSTDGGYCRSQFKRLKEGSVKEIRLTLTKLAA